VSANVGVGRRVGVSGRASGSSNGVAERTAVGGGEGRGVRTACALPTAEALGETGAGVGAIGEGSGTRDLVQASPARNNGARKRKSRPKAIC